MSDKGMGGFFIHSREGLETSYLSEGWMEQVDVAVREAKEKDMEVWIYDEDKWPSGCAGGLVSRANPCLLYTSGNERSDRTAGEISLS